MALDARQWQILVTDGVHKMRDNVISLCFFVFFVFRKPLLWETQISFRNKDRNSEMMGTVKLKPLGKIGRQWEFQHGLVFSKAQKIVGLKVISMNTYQSHDAHNIIICVYIYIIICLYIYIYCIIYIYVYIIYIIRILITWCYIYIYMNMYHM